MKFVDAQPEASPFSWLNPIETNETKTVRTEVIAKHRSLNNGAPPNGKYQLGEI